MTDIIHRGVKASEAIENIRKKVGIQTPYWDYLLGEAHAKAFTVAGATKADLLSDFHEAVTDSIENGLTISDFRKRFDDIVEQHGWSYRGSRGWRTQIIYSTNLRTAHASGKWQKIEATKKTYPYLIYKTVGDNRVRDLHRQWHDVALSVDDPFWDTHYPPNGWNCRCYPVQANNRMLDRQGIEVGDAPAIKKTERINSRTGEVYGDVAEGIDTGWDYNVGKAWLGSDIAFGEKIASMPGDLRQGITQTWTFNRAIDQSFKLWSDGLFKQIDAGKVRPKGEVKTLSFLSNGQMNSIVDAGFDLKNAAVMISDKQVFHAFRKVKKNPLTRKQFESLPKLMRDATAIVTDGKALLFVLKTDSGTAKAVVSVDYSLKKQRFNNVITTQLVPLKDLKNAKVYQIVYGSVQ